MLLGMTRGEIGLVVFIFALIYSAQLVPRLGELVGELVAGGGRRRPARGADAADGAPGETRRQKR